LRRQRQDAFDASGKTAAVIRLSQSHDFRHRMILRIRTIICGDQ
jgi:hypothetical protein